MTVCAGSSVELSSGADSERKPRDAVAVSRLGEVSFRAFYQEHFTLVYGLIGRYGVPSSELEDLTQRVFMVVHAQSDELARLENPKAWLRAIAVRIVHEHHRWSRVRRMHAWLLSHSWAARSVDERTPEHAVSADETAVEVHAVLGRMSTKLRDALVLLELEELSPREAAEILRIPVNTLRSRRILAREEFGRLWQATRRRAGGE